MRLFFKSFPHRIRQIKLDLNLLYIVIGNVDLWITNFSFFPTNIDRTMWIEMLISGALFERTYENSEILLHRPTYFLYKNGEWSINMESYSF